MEIMSAYASRIDAEAALASLTLEPGAVVCWDRGTSSREPARPCDWLALVLALCIEEHTDGMYAVMAFVLTPGRRVRRYNARFVRRP